MINNTAAKPAPAGPAKASSAVQIDLDVHVTRGALVESVHRVHAAIVDADGQLVAAARNPHHVTWWRSCAKPFQVMPLVERGALDRLGWGDDELALACASHGGEPEHVAIANHMLSTLGLEEGDLACGPHEPLAHRGARVLRESNARATRVHNNCSGKHAAMLALARELGNPTQGYERSDHAAQQEIRRSVEHWTGAHGDALQESVDGCGVVVFALSLYHMALSYARFAAAINHNHPVAARVGRAMLSSPFLLGGTDRFDTVLMESAPGNIICKIGAEGVHTLAVLDRNIGIAVKVEDGTPRAQYPAVLGALAFLDVVLHDSTALSEFREKPLRNTRGEVVGHVSLAGTDGTRIGTGNRS